MDVLACKSKGGIFDSRTNKCHIKRWNKLVSNVPSVPGNKQWLEDKYYLNDRLQFKIKHKSQNTELAMMYLQQAISNRYSEQPIQGYIKFLGSLPVKERKEILQDDEITKLIDVINRYHLG